MPAGAQAPMVAGAGASVRITASPAASTSAPPASVRMLGASARKTQASSTLETGSRNISTPADGASTWRRTRAKRTSRSAVAPTPSATTPATLAASGGVTRPVRNATGATTTVAVAVSQNTNVGAGIVWLATRPRMMRTAKLKPAARPTATASGEALSAWLESVATTATPTIPTASAGQVAGTGRSPVSGGASSATNIGPVYTSSTASGTDASLMASKYRSQCRPSTAPRSTSRARPLAGTSSRPRPTASTAASTVTAAMATRKN